MAFVIVDTDVLIDAGRGDGVAGLQRLEQQSSLAVSVVTQMEMIVGCRNKTELLATEKFLQRFQILNLKAQISDASVNLLRRYRLSHGLLIADALIAATAIEYDESFITKNQRDYRFIPDLNLLPYP